MNLSEMLKEPVVSVLEQLKLALWVEVVTAPMHLLLWTFCMCKVSSKAASKTLKTSNRNQLK